MIRVLTSFTVFFLLVLAGCAGKKTTESMGPAYGKTEAPAQETVPKSQWTNKKIAFVFGGAGVGSVATAGFLKRMNEAGIEPEFIVTTGWPTVFALSYGLMNSVHDLEWFSTKLKNADFFTGRLFSFSKGYSSHENLRKLLHKTLRKKALGQSRIPLWLTYSSTRELKPDYQESGLWEAPALKALSVPGLHRPYRSSGNVLWTFSREWLDIDLAREKGAEIVVAVGVYEDYFRFFWPKNDDEPDSVLKQVFVTENRDYFRAQLKKADIGVNIDIGRKPTEFKYARRAFIAGYKEAGKVIEELSKKLRK